MTRRPPQPRPNRRWPRIPLRIPLVFLTHPFELALAAALVVAGIRGVFGDVTPSLASLPEMPRALYLAVSTTGGVGLIVGVSTSDPNGHVGLGLSIERAALFLVGASYAGLAILLVGNNGSEGVPTAIVAAVIGLACLLRTVAIRRSVRIVLRTLRNRNASARPVD
jgi:hypothetical protein